MKKLFANFEVLSVFSINTLSYAAVTPFRLVNRYLRPFYIQVRLFLDFSTLKIELFRSSETQVPIYQSTRRNIPDDMNICNAACLL